MTPTPHSSPVHATGAKDTDVIGTSQKIWGFFGSVFAIVLAIFLIIGVRGCMAEKEAKETAAKEAAVAKARLQAATRAAAVPARKWEHRTLSIPPEGLTITLCQGAYTWPKWGPVNIYTLEGRLVLHDRPGVRNQIDLVGTYVWRADPPGSKREIQVYNCW